MFHDHIWYDKSISNHLDNNEIFISFPCKDTQFLSGNFVPCYDKIDKPQKTCFHDIEWLFPSKCYDLFICNWDCKSSLYNLTPILENWYDCKDKIRIRIDAQINELAIDLNKTQAAVKVCHCLCLLLYLFFLCFWCLSHVFGKSVFV